MEILFACLFAVTVSVVSQPAHQNQTGTAHFNANGTNVGLPLPLEITGPVDCSLEPETGPCKAAFEAFFYNSTARECQYFTYGGCDGNSNRFESEEECRQQCASPAQNLVRR